MGLAVHQRIFCNPLGSSMMEGFGDGGLKSAGLVVRRLFLESAAHTLTASTLYSHREISSLHDTVSEQAALVGKKCCNTYALLSDEMGFLSTTVTTTNSGNHVTSRPKDSENGEVSASSPSSAKASTTEKANAIKNVPRFANIGITPLLRSIRSWKARLVSSWLVSSMSGDGDPAEAVSSDNGRKRPYTRTFTIRGAVPSQIGSAHD